MSDYVITTFAELERAAEYAKRYHDTNTPTITESATPPGTVALFAGSKVPSGWLLCNGSTANRTTYADLYSAIGTTWGSGDGNTTFNLPDFRDYFPEGAGSSYSNGASISSGLPGMTGSFDIARMASDGNKSNSGGDIIINTSGVISISSEGGGNIVRYWRWMSGITYYSSRVTLTVSNSNSIYNSSSTVQPAALAVYYIIKT